MNEMNDYMRLVADRAGETIKEEPGDFVRDGLLHCGKCGTPKEVRVSFGDASFTARCICRCASEKRERENEEILRRQRAERARRASRAGIPGLENMTFEADDGSNEKLMSVARRYVDNFGEMLRSGSGLLFYGGVGTGKTFIAACIANALIEKGHPCLVTSFPRIVNTLFGMQSGRQDYLDSLSAFDLLVIDDLASERVTEFMNETVTEVIDSRSRSGLPLIVTTNLTPEDMLNPPDLGRKRIYSRIREMCCPVAVKGPDRRLGNLKGGYDTVPALFGII